MKRFKEQKRKQKVEQKIHFLLYYLVFQSATFMIFTTFSELEALQNIKVVCTKYRNYWFNGILFDKHYNVPTGQ